MLTPEQIAEGWIEHDGGECPVADDSRPSVILQGVFKYNPTRVGKSWDGWRANDVDWSAVVAYKPEPTP